MAVPGPFAGMQESTRNDLSALAGQAFLAEASRLLASSLDYETTLAVVAELALPHLGAWCIVDVVEEDGRMQRLAIVHPDPSRQVMARRLERGWPPESDDPLGVPVVVRTRRAEVIPEVTEEMLHAAAHGAENMELLRALGLGSLMVVPLVARGHVHGAITFVSSDARHRYGARDLELAEDLAARAAMAIDNARLYRAAERSRAQAQEASRAKSEFLATMSHELRTPLNAIQGYAELLELEIAGPLTEAQREQVTRVRTSSRHLLGLVDEVLDLARVEAGQLPVGRERASVQEAVDDALARARAAAEARGVRLLSSCAAAPPHWYVGDVRRVAQVLDALLSNAVRFTPAGGEVRVGCSTTRSPEPDARLASPAPWTCVAVEDTGIGIAPEHAAAVFEPFHQEEGGHTRTEGGPGLGLTVARQLARLMGGDVTLRSTPGEGSVFTLWLPAAAEQRKAPRPAQRPASDREAMCVAGRRLTSDAESLIQSYLRRLRADPAIAHAEGLGDVDLADHAATLVADVGQSLQVLGSAPADDASALMRDGSRIQRLVAELHADQRRRLGWTVEEVRRDFEVLREEVERALRLQLPSEDPATDEAVATAARLLRQSERIGLQAFHAAAPAGV